MRQHFVPQCYLRAWCDPNIPNGYEPYLWKFTKDGKQVKKNAPKKIFRERDMYTITTPDGSKDYRLERGLHDLEDHFVRIRDNKIAKQHNLTSEDRILLLAFVAAMHNRSRVQRDHQKHQWGHIFEMADKMKNWAENTTPEQRRQAARPSLPGGSGKGLSYDDVKKIATEPMQQLLFLMISIEIPLLNKLSMAILCTSASPGFITSDRPCVWFDPKAILRPPFFRAPALMYETIEITLPVSPNQTVFLNRAGKDGYLDVSPQLVDALNIRNRVFSDEYFVVNSNIVKDIWFDYEEKS